MSMDKPSQPYPSTPTTTPSPQPLWQPDPSIQGAGFDQLLKNRGVTFVHQKAIPCPNMKSTTQSSHEPDCPICDSSGLTYYAQKNIVGVFSGNNIQKTFEAQGIWEMGSATITFPTQYDDGTQADFNTYDRLTIPDFEVRLWQLKEYEPRPGGVQELRYPVINVEYASAVINDVQVFYQQGVDFNIVNGNIVWVAGKEPPYDNNNERGTVIAWAYFANPVYVVVQSLRELRITQEVINGQKTARRLPQQVLVKRDFLVQAGESYLGTTPS